MAIVNIGGVANMTWIGANGELIAFDTGPGNALLNDWCEHHTDVPFDRDGVLAAGGTLDAKAFKVLALDSDFDRPYRSRSIAMRSIFPFSMVSRQKMVPRHLHISRQPRLRVAWVMCLRGRNSM